MSRWLSRWGLAGTSGGASEAAEPEPTPTPLSSLRVGVVSGSDSDVDFTSDKSPKTVYIYNEASVGIAVQFVGGASDYFDFTLGDLEGSSWVVVDPSSAIQFEVRIIEQSNDAQETAAFAINHSEEIHGVLFINREVVDDDPVDVVQVFASVAPLPVWMREKVYTTINAPLPALASAWLAE